MNRYCFPLVIGLITVAVLVLCISQVCQAEIGIASFYSTECCRYNRDLRCPTASGKSLYDLERSSIPFAASWNYPFGTTLRVCRVNSHDQLWGESRCVDVQVLDRGPARRLGRLIDLSRLAYQRLADLKTGTIRVTVERLP